MANNAAGKGNPASHRMSNKELQARRSRCWANGEKRKKARRAVQDAAEKRNRELRALGQRTPWEEACHVRRARRAAAQLTKTGRS